MATDSKTQPVLVYTPSSQLADLPGLYRLMLRDIAGSRELAWRLLVRNIRSRYRQTMLGYLWAFVPPVLNTLVFVFLQRTGYFTVGQTQVPYALFLFAGLILWQLFTDAINAPLRMVQQSYSILSKVNFPRESLIIAGIGEVLFGFIVRLALMTAALLWFNTISWSLIWVPFGVLVLIALGVGLGLLIMPVAILYHDVGQGLPFVLYLWMFLTPVLYPAPETWPASSLVTFNPVTALLDTTRAWMISTSPEHFGAFLVVTALTTAMLLAGWLVYRLALPILIERMSA